MVEDRVLLAGGYSNEVWRVRRGRTTLIEKRYSGAPPEPNPMYPNLPDHEATVLRHLEGTGLAPRFVSFEAHASGAAGPVLLYHYVPGTQWRRGVGEVAVLLHRVHSIDPPRGLRSLHRSGNAALARADEVIDDVPTGDRPLRELRRRLDAVRRPVSSGAALRRPSLVHTDCGPGNIVRSRHGLVLIDWQCPGIGDPVEDIACFLSPAMMVLYHAPPHTPRAAARFLEAYPDTEVIERYRAEGSAWHHRIAAYCLWRSHRLRRSRPEIAERYRLALEAELEVLSAW